MHKSLSHQLLLLRGAGTCQSLYTVVAIGFWMVARQRATDTSVERVVLSHLEGFGACGRGLGRIALSVPIWLPYSLGVCSLLNGETSNTYSRERLASCRVCLSRLCQREAFCCPAD
ncbi:unnamed protein product [Polarella glacialis]|uniref:Uncharacterized protein n=1 Tax=Polarella glacialis TaxID=89957 RepID=A0A813D934_POLGL|nr:unnamed protein product [Polarella glacialis]